MSATATATATGRPVITAWTAISPFGIGSRAFADGLRDGRPTVAPLDQDTWQAATDSACLVPDFDVRAVLGKKGTRSMDRVTGLAVAAVSSLLDGAPCHREVATGPRAALVLGTTTGSVQSQMDFTRDSFTNEKPYFVDPARFPNAVMNCAAGQSAIWHQLKGPNTTIAGGRAAGLYALNYSRMLVAFGRARTVLCGAVEEFSHARSWLERHAQAQAPEPAAEAVPMGEGCGLLLIERASGGRGGDQRVLAEVLATELAVATGDEVRATLTRCLRRALTRSGVRQEEIWAVSTSESFGTAGAAERTALAEVVGEAAPVRLSHAALIGDAGAATATFQIAGVLAAAERDGDAAGRAAVITSVDRDGAVGCAVFRLR
ncbi:beta-ketoacyl synthase N-terminal-like domain-containing protein [Streptomyces sp. SBT349]|uniref:beta-ketoacyl synthase N-terminal-like domain-containing protein n=1 Tax=Streptomyces sp. SBT349 TaxID=1580539 RepID=UPI00066EF732|nr:beta-ketoacyl synthase N-terminal-like domain-containing protein [Streptomyces sp. SBT349]